MIDPVNYYEPMAAIVDDRECPGCGESIDMKAKVCPHCQADVLALDKKVRGKIPRGVKVLAYLYFVIAAFMCLGLFGILAVMRGNPVLAIVTGTMYLGIISLVIALAVSYLKGYQWSWWYTVASSFIAILTTLYGIAAIQLKWQVLPAQAPIGMVTGFQIGSIVVVMIILATFLWPDAKEYFRIQNAGWKRLLLAIVAVFAFQFLLFSLPTIAVSYFMGPEALVPKFPDQNEF
ncbi:hypothetical protein [Lacunimicrobium album]